MSGEVSVFIFDFYLRVYGCVHISAGVHTKAGAPHLENSLNIIGISTFLDVAFTKTSKYFLPGAQKGFNGK